MINSKMVFRTRTKQITQRWMIQGLVICYEIIAIVALIIMSISAIDWIRTPFLGTFIEHSLFLSNTHPKHIDTWPLQNFAGETRYQLIAIDGQEVTSVTSLNNQLKEYQIGQDVTATLRSIQGLEDDVVITLTNFPRTDQLTFFLIPFLIGLLFIGCSVWIFALRGNDSLGQAFVVFCTSVAIVIAGLFDIHTTDRLTYMWTASLGLTGGAFFSLAIFFPQEHLITIRYPFLRWAGYALALGSVLYACQHIYFLNTPLIYPNAWWLELILVGIGFIFFILIQLSHQSNTSFPAVREQSRLALMGTAISIIPILGWLLAMIVSPNLKFSPYILLTLTIFPITLTYIISRYRLPNTNYLISRAIVYIILTLFVTVGYALLASGTSLILGDSLTTRNVYITGAFFFIIALGLIPLKNALQKNIDSALLRSQITYRYRSQAFSRELTSAVDLTAILKLLREYIQEYLNPIHLHLFVYDPLIDFYVATSDPSSDSQEPTSDLRFASSSTLVTTLFSQHASIFLGEARSIPASLQPEQARITLLNSQLLIPLPGRERLTGWLAVGQRSSGEAYTHDDLEFLESICDQAALAIERTQVVVDLENRVHAMNVLTRVSQGINVTLSFDDILELIFAQTNQIIPTEDFRITLYDHANDYLYPVFYLENDERLASIEKQPVPLGRGLEREVIRERRPIVCDDYEHECKVRGVLPISDGLYAWIGVPLNTGTETIGVLSVANRNPTINYTSEQSSLLQAIADQVAGAIIKAQLLEESEKRARHLLKLNEVTRSLTSTLAIEPLLEQILNSAIEILSCESGNLLLVEQNSGYLVLKAAFGPDASGLIGLRIPKGSGLVGKAVDTHLPIIHNDIRRPKDRSSKVSDADIYIPSDILVVPMLVKDRVIGVIEVINRKDGLPFTAEDQDLLIAFSGQASVALENARLYTMTDQNLAARVEELSVMQRIDRELNTSLDIGRAMRITLEWAMRQSNADAGLVGTMDADKIQIMTAQGYGNELLQYPDAVMPADLPLISASIATSQPQWASTTSPREIALAGSILTHCRSQAVIPIRRERQVIGIILLESLHSEPYPTETQAFLSRLSDHAAIAISNSQLFSAVQAANLAKSDFISFVSHELKTPMTSIKGFSDLLSSEAVGTINETQLHFLNTIHSNIDRMTTLVSDLADASRIETGRLRLEFSPVQVEDIVYDVSRSAQRQIDDKHQHLTVVIDKGLPPIWGDKTRLIQILTNLVNNAYKYTPEGGDITLKATLAINQHDPSETSKVIQISVKDNGIGISPENQKNIFQKFYRVDDQKVRDTPGTGLGLNITKTLVEMQGGHIWFESAINVGTTFHVTIPVVENI